MMTSLKDVGREIVRRIEGDSCCSAERKAAVYRKTKKGLGNAKQPAFNKAPRLRRRYLQAMNAAKWRG